MKQIFIVLTYTGTILSKIIKTYTKDIFSHVSISLDDDLKEMYSFGRLNPYNPFIGGFVHEGINHGTFKRFKNTTTSIYVLNITEEQYEKIKVLIKKIGEEREKYKFNVIGLFAVGLKIKIQSKNSFYCAEFVKYILESANIDTNLNNIIKPEHFRYLDNINLVYRGKLKDYEKRDKVKSKKYLNDMLSDNILEEKGIEQKV